MRIDALSSTLHPVAGTLGERRNATTSSAQRESISESPRRPSDGVPASREEIVGALQRFAQLDKQRGADGSQEGLPLNGRRALDAYVGTEREEEKRYLHETLGVDLFV